jgi:acyl-homoserine-lactone acylase
LPRRASGASIIAMLTALLLAAAAPASASELPRWKAEAARVTITRDHWGIAHVHGRTDADAVFGMVYAQAEDDFPRIERNYLVAMGRQAEAEGERALWSDLRARLYTSETKMRADFARSPAWLKALSQAWADGLNFYLATHPAVRPKVLKRFEPWMAFSFTEGSIGGDIERIDLKALAAFYGKGANGKLAVRSEPLREPRGSNGIAIAPALTANGRALLLINPHTSLFFRSEQQMSSDEGLNAYGAATWGQFFIYQGFNANAGWMHTSSGVDNVDEFAETLVRKGPALFYRYGQTLRPVTRRPIAIRVREPSGKLVTRTFSAAFTHHGPIVRANGDKWIAFAMMDRPVEALQQSWLRTKATSLDSFLKVANLRGNSSNNTLFADSKGAIAYLHAQFVPRRSGRFDYTRPVDGSDPATDWGSLHGLGELPSSIRPVNGWVQNTNSGPYRAAGAYSPQQRDYPGYMDTFGPNFREDHAIGLLTGKSGWTLEKLQAAAYDPFQPGFAAIIPPLIAAFDALPRGDARRAALRDPVALLRGWDYRWSLASEAQTLATAWGERLARQMPKRDEPFARTIRRLPAETSPDQKLAALGEAIARLQADWGRWRVAWGEVNRYQRYSGDLDAPFRDDRPSVPVPFASGNFGSLASLGVDANSPTKRRYGVAGNSFVAVVEFGPRVRARAVKAGGQSGDPASPHFADQAQLYADGNLRQVYFWPADLAKATERKYRPGE